MRRHEREKFDEELRQRDQEFFDALPDFNEYRSCDKCGHGEATVEYLPLSYYRSPVISTLQRRCKRCGYIWQEKPLS